MLHNWVGRKLSLVAPYELRLAIVGISGGRNSLKQQDGFKERDRAVSNEYGMHEDLLMILAVAELSHAIKCGVNEGKYRAEIG